MLTAAECVYEGITKYIFSVDYSSQGFPGGSDGKNLPAVKETWVWLVSWEDTLEKGMATHSSILA